MRWSPSGRRSRASRRGWRAGAARVGRPGGRLVDQDRPARRRRCAAGERSGTVFVFDPFGLAGVALAHVVAAARRAAPGTARSRSRGGSPPPASSISAASRAATSGRSRPSSGWRRCCTPPRATGAGIESVVRWAYGQGARELDEALGTRRPARRATRRELADAHAAYDAVRAFEAQADRTRSSIEATAQALLRAYRFARVARSAAVVRDHRRPAARRARRRCT